MRLKIGIGIYCLVISVFQNVSAQKTTSHTVAARKSNADTMWVNYPARTVDQLPEFKFKKEPALNKYGSWQIDPVNATGFFRIEKINERWWIIDPDGYPFIHKGVAVYRPGASEIQKKKMQEKYNDEKGWIKKESALLRENGFNGTGAWSAVDLIRASDAPLVYTVIINPMQSYKAEHLKRFGGKYKVAGWQGFRFDLTMVFDPEFDRHVEKTIGEIAQYRDDKFLLGYYTDNELPWKTDALDIHLSSLAEDEPGYIAARKWFDNRKGKQANIEDITEDDRLAFSGFYFETYLSKVAAAIKKYDPNHMYLGCRFNQMNRQELTNPEIFKVAGKYMDIVSINHYRMWQPDPVLLKNWEKWSGKPFLITEWYTKGVDSGLPNNGGAGWLVKTQQDRGYFYQNFAIELIKSKNCVGWHWFTYQDNDPENMNVDESNRDSNKGIVDSEFNQYQPLLKEMKMLNDNVFNLIHYFNTASSNQQNESK
ncbi:MAG: hypothetical protein ABIN80_09690 [Dyadobacter sp.]|uniref:hypothetical protein n=1 Tax=Dyadobacter sp. TaxID=1914288 RepID=UPI0032657BAD